MDNHALHYIIRFLLGNDIPEEVVAAIGYTNNPIQYSHYHIIIIPSNFFQEQIYGTKASFPQLPLQEIEGIPLLFGKPIIEKKKDTIIIHADIIASTYFLITRYEEFVQRNERDEHGRFPGKKSLPNRAGFIHRPIIDEYRILFRKWLQMSGIHVTEIKKEIQHIYLTHDLDSPFLYRSWKGVIRSIKDKKGLIQSIQNKYGPAEKDPYYTFPWLFEQNKKFSNAIDKKKYTSIFFVRCGGNCKQDKPHYKLTNSDIQELIKTAQNYGMIIGLHSSYQAGIHPQFIQKEKQRLENYLKQTVCFNRHHFLNSREPEDMDLLEATGITDDFTMGYADKAGFRLGTCHPVRWINPVNQRLSNITLHPLTLMDSTLEEKKYMGLNQTEALNYSLNLIEQIQKVGGEVNLLWHNTSIQNGINSYLRTLYSTLLNKLAKK